MKFSKIALAMGCGLVLISGLANAANGGKVNFTGEIIEAACSITAPTVEQTVDLGKVATAALKNGGTSTPVPFQIDLELCDVSGLTNKTVTATWAGTANTLDTTLWGITGNASGAGIALRDAANKEIKPGDTSSATTLVDGSNTIAMSAFLRGDGSADIVPGTFTATANFALNYQ